MVTLIGTVVTPSVSYGAVRRCPLRRCPPSRTTVLPGMSVVAASVAEGGQHVASWDDQQAAANSHPDQHVGVLLIGRKDR